MEAFEELRHVGRGAFREVSLMRRRADGALCAVKRIPRQTVTGGAECAADHEAEVMALKGLAHPCILRFWGSFHDQASIRLVTEYADAGDLERLLRRRSETGQALEALVLLAIFAQLAVAVAHVHANHVLHRDLKPSNILVTAQGFMKLGDFGVAKEIAGTAVCDAMTTVGSPVYIAPEVVNGEPYGPPCDVWSLGVVLYELSTFQKPFHGRSFWELAMRISAGKFRDVGSCILIAGGAAAAALAAVVEPLTQQMLVTNMAERVPAADIADGPVLALFAASVTKCAACVAVLLREMGICVEIVAAGSD